MIGEVGFAFLATLIEKASTCEDVFGLVVPPKSAADHVHTTYKRIAVLIHPDRQPVEDQKRATLAFTILNTWKTQADQKVIDGTYGKRNVLPKNAPEPGEHPPTIVDTKKRKYLVEQVVAHGDVADLYNCSFTEKTGEQHAIFKLTRAAGDSDLLENEQRVLTLLFKDSQKVIEKAAAAGKKSTFYHYLPRLLDSFLLKTPGGANRRVNVLSPCTDFVGLDAVLRAFPKGLDYRDVVWMFKRMLVATGFIHTKGVIHGAVIPPHVLVHPVNHGAVLVDWCYAVSDTKSHIKAISKEWRPFYAPEIFKKEPPTASTDIYMVVKCVIALLGGNVETGKTPSTVPRPLQGFLESCVVALPSRRPHDAWKLHDELDELLQRIVGAPKYRPLVMPAKS
jgi:hypothetical protein